jgi:hypothetical protein
VRAVLAILLLAVAALAVCQDEILVSAIAPRSWVYNLSATAPEWKRVAISTPVGSLHRVLNDLRSRGVKVEHVYDY